MFWIVTISMRNVAPNVSVSNNGSWIAQDSFRWMGQMRGKWKTSDQDQSVPVGGSVYMANGLDVFKLLGFKPLGYDVYPVGRTGEGWWINPPKPVADRSFDWRIQATDDPRAKVTMEDDGNDGGDGDTAYA
jgi:hypothetical protein